MGTVFTKPIKEITQCHYDVHPYRDAFYKRNRPCYLLSCTFFYLLILTILSGLLYTSSSNGDDINSGLSDNFVNNLSSLFRLNRTTIIKDIKNIYPSDLELSISRNQITANQPFPICIAAPKFLMPILQSPSLDDLNKNKNKHASSSNIDDIKKAHDTLGEDMFKKRANNWLKAPSFFKDDKLQNLEDDPLLDLKIEEMWHSVIGYRLDPQCFIRIDPSSSQIINRLKEADVDPSTFQTVICSDQNVKHLYILVGCITNNYEYIS